MRPAAFCQQPPQVLELATVNFADSSSKYPAHITNDTKGRLDNIASVIQQNSNARLVIVGHAVTKEPSKIGAQRAVNVRSYLIEEKGIPPGLVTTLYGGKIEARTATLYLVPSGSKFDKEPGAVAVPASVQPTRRDPMDKAEGGCAPQ